MSGGAMGRELAVPGQTYEDFLKKTDDIAFMRHHLSALEEEVTIAEAERLKRIIIDGQAAFNQLAALLGSGQAAHDFLKGTYQWASPQIQPLQRQQQQQHRQHQQHQQHHHQHQHQHQQQIPIRQAYSQDPRHSVASTSRIQELPPHIPNQGPRLSRQSSQTNPYSAVLSTSHVSNANLDNASRPTAPPLPHRNTVALRPNTAQQNPVRLASPANNSTSSSPFATVPNVLKSAINPTTSNTPTAIESEALSALNDVMLRVHSTGVSEVFGEHIITKDGNDLKVFQGSKAFRVPLPKEAPTHRASEASVVTGATNGGDVSQAHALTPDTPGLVEAIERVRKSHRQEVFQGYTIAEDSNGDTIISKDDYYMRVVPNLPLSSRTPQPLPQTITPAALDARSRNLNSTSTTNGHVNSQNQASVPDPAPLPAVQVSTGTPLPLVSTASSLSTTQPVPVPSPLVSQPVPVPVAQPAPSAPRSSSVTSESPSRLARPPEKKTLAHDLLRAFGKKRPREDVSSSEVDTPANKKHAPNKPASLAESARRSSTPSSSKAPQSATSRPVPAAAVTDSASRSATPSTVANAASSNPLATAITHSFSHYRASTRSFSSGPSPHYRQAQTPSQPAGIQPEKVASVPAGQHYSRLVTQQPQSSAQQSVTQVVRQPSSSGSQQPKPPVTQHPQSWVPQQPQSSVAQSPHYKPFYARQASVQGTLGRQPTSVSMTVTPSPVKNQDATPLFLDSPDSPLPSYASSTQNKKVLSAKALGKQKVVEVMLPSPPQWVRDDQERRRRRRMKEKEKVHEVEEEEEEEVKELTKLAVHGALSMSSGDADEENALEIVQTRLRTMKCKWGKCDGILNSAQRAYRHLLSHGEATDGAYLCQWDGCGANLKSFSTWQVHAASHTLRPILCAYESCEESYTDALSYINHSLERHRNNELRLSSNPVMPVGSVDLANIPSSLPSYRSVHRSISQYPISAERHATLGVWVLKNMTGDVDLPDKRKGLPTGAQLRERHKYDYLDELARPSINPSKGVQFRKMDDLDTGLATKLFHEGLVLWPGQAMLKEEEEERAKKEEAEALVKIEKEPIQEEGQSEAITREAVHVNDGVGNSRASVIVID